MLAITGQTWRYRDELKNMGGRWNGDARRWEIEKPTTRTRELLAGMVGCVVSEEASAPEFKPEIGEDWAGLATLRPAKLETPERKSNIYGDDPRYHNYFAPKNPLAFFGFSSLSAFTDYVESVPADKSQTAWSQDTHQREFTATDSITEAIDLARNGWLDMIELANDIANKLETAHAVRKARVYSTAGGAVSVGRMLAGNPVHMRRREKLPGRRVITLFVELSMLAVIKPTTMIMRAIVVAALCDLIERNGYSCGIVTVDTSTHARQCAYQLAVQIKEPGEKLNISDIAFAIGHPSFLRRFSFATVCSVQELRSIWTTQGGTAAAFDDEHQPERNEFYIKGMTANSVDPFEILRLIKPDGLPIELKDT